MITFFPFTVAGAWANFDPRCLIGHIVPCLHTLEPLLERICLTHFRRLGLSQKESTQRCWVTSLSQQVATTLREMISQDSLKQRLKGRSVFQILFGLTLTACLLWKVNLTMSKWTNRPEDGIMFAFIAQFRKLQRGLTKIHCNLASSKQKKAKLRHCCWVICSNKIVPSQSFDCNVFLKYAFLRLRLCYLCRYKSIVRNSVLSDHDLDS